MISPCCERVLKVGTGSRFCPACGQVFLTPQEARETVEAVFYPPPTPPAFLGPEKRRSGPSEAQGRLW